MTFSCARRMSSLLSGCQSRLACSSKRACIVLRAVISVVPSEVLGRIIIMTPRTECRPSLHTRVLGDIPQLGGIQHVDDRKGDNGRGVTRQLKRIGNVIGKMSAGRYTAPAMPTCLTKERGSFRVWPARSSAAVAPAGYPPRARGFTDNAPTVGKLTTAAEVIAQ